MNHPVQCPRCNQPVEALTTNPGLKSVADTASARAMMAQLCNTCWKDMGFYINTINGGIGQMVLRSLLEFSGYEVTPYGYEHNFYNVMKHFRHTFNDSTAEHIRTTPDLLVVDPEPSGPKAFLVEVKTTSRGISSYLVEKSKLDRYKTHWPTSWLAVLHLPSMTFYVVAVEQVNTSFMTARPISNGTGQLFYTLDLTKPYSVTLPEVFSRVNKQELDTFMDQVKVEMWGKYANQLAHQPAQSMWPR